MRLSLCHRCLHLTLLIIFLVAACLCPLTSAYYPPKVERLRCMACVPSIDDTTQLDQFRVRQKLSEPRCAMEPVKCRAEQDACATITMQVSMNRYWVGAGCDQRVNYDIPADKHGCAEMATLTRSWLPGYVEERRAIQKICVCTGDLCNAGVSEGSSVIFISCLCLLAWLFLSAVTT
uniref:Protein quiver n=1 Tax=Panagrellus redivivus TaxID=6233 RepID=A0A7E4ZWX8_PANRE